MRHVNQALSALADANFDLREHQDFLAVTPEHVKFLKRRATRAARRLNKAIITHEYREYYE